MTGQGRPDERTARRRGAPGARPTPTTHYGAASIRPRWRDRVVLLSLVAHLFLVVAYTAWYWVTWDGTVGDAGTWATAPLVGIPLAAMLRSALLAPERGNPGEVVMRWGNHLPLLLPLAAVEGGLAWLTWWIAVNRFHRYGLDYLPGGAMVTLVVAGTLGWMLWWVVGLALTWMAARAGAQSPVLRLVGLPLVLAATLGLGLGIALGVDIGNDDGPGMVIRALAGDYPVTSGRWLEVTRWSAWALAVGMITMVGTLFAGTGPDAPTDGRQGRQGRR